MFRQHGRDNRRRRIRRNRRHLDLDRIGAVTCMHETARTAIGIKLDLRDGALEKRFAAGALNDAAE